MLTIKEKREIRKKVKKQIKRYGGLGRLPILLENEIKLIIKLYEEVCLINKKTNKRTCVALINNKGDFCLNNLEIRDYNRKLESRAESYNTQGFEVKYIRVIYKISNILTNILITISSKIKNIKRLFKKKEVKTNRNTNRRAKYNFETIFPNNTKLRLRAYDNYRNAIKRAKIEQCYKELTQDEKDEIRSIYELATFLTYTEGVNYHVDHIIPMATSLGKTIKQDYMGLHMVENLQVVREDYNIQKANIIDFDLYPEQREVFNKVVKR